ncbi:hypothetical protein FEM33_15395 [Dyadobacter flavalbus]|uniref:Uncharacterized protein n=1 Tax=Dyadobacter flavalbus TaxID=2579942 RepID=A0A5M8QRM6_9BACT|nr:hypothetical protein [Dyadobacter flavalbus]KAA6438855.1 hypothetical protein FEM33_15395 [Dyadobacter flavalbus]
MNPREYYKKTRNALSYGILKTTIHELLLGGELELADEVQINMQKNLIVKPPLHNSISELASNHYLIEMSSDDIDRIINFFFELEANSVIAYGEGTPKTALYSSLVDSWSMMREVSTLKD